MKCVCKKNYEKFIQGVVYECDSEYVSDGYLGAELAGFNLNRDKGINETVKLEDFKKNFELLGE